MRKIELTINNQPLEAQQGQTIAEAAAAAGIQIPTLCSDTRLSPHGACGICIVEVAGFPKFKRACSTLAEQGMGITTDSPRVHNARKTILALMLSDHSGDCRPPCMLACPAETDCQGYVSLIANGEYEEAASLIREKIPLPSSIGRICPHPCETECRRKLAEEPINIATLKYFAGDLQLERVPITAIAKDTGHNVGIIGGGPGGLTAAYFLRLKGHNVTVYDAMPKMGGMLRYGIPEYRLPKKVLDAELRLFEEMGIVFKNNLRIGRDVALDALLEPLGCCKTPKSSPVIAGLTRNPQNEHVQQAALGIPRQARNDVNGSHNALVVAIGAWDSMPIRCKGEEGRVVKGIEFLRGVATGDKTLMQSYKNKRVAVVGGGFTAMDVARTAIRLGAAQVNMVYRRTEKEMPAFNEMHEAKEEGVIFRLLEAPLEVLGEPGNVIGLRVQKMSLGEPDASGRRSPVPIEGAEEILPVDIVISAIGQNPKPDGFEALELTKRGAINVTNISRDDFSTNLPGVFAVGDAVNGGSIAIEAIGHAQKACESVHAWLMTGKTSAPSAPILVRDIKTEADFADTPKMPRREPHHTAPEARSKSFAAVTSGFAEEEARAEANRCLSCGCTDFFECKLIKYANEYRADAYQADQKYKYDHDTSHPFFLRDQNKCILCGMCARACDEVVGSSVYSTVRRGLGARVETAYNMPIADSDCIGCGTCVELCPTGALVEKLPLDHPLTAAENSVKTICTGCSVGCKAILTSRGRLLLRRLPDTDANPRALLCTRGRFGFGEWQRDTVRLTAPRIRQGDTFADADLKTALRLIKTHLEKLTGSIGIAISGSNTNEDIAAIKAWAAEIDAKVFSFDVPAVIPSVNMEDISAEKIPRFWSEEYETPAILPAPNSCGLIDAGVPPAEETDLSNLRGLIAFGYDERIPDKFPGLEFLTVIDPADRAGGLPQSCEVLLPGLSFAEITGTYTNTIGDEQELYPAVPPCGGLSPTQWIKKISTGYTL